MPAAAKLTTSAAEGLPRRRFTVAEVEAMVAAGVMEEDERVELIGGELVPMSPKGNHHEVVKTALAAIDGIRAAPGRIDWLARDDFSPERRHLSRARRRDLPPRERHHGASARAMSCSSSRSRTRRCATTSAARRRFTPSFGIRELWVIDAVRLTTRVFREPAADGYREARDFGPADRLAPLIAPEAFALRLDELELS